jgi:hypothetical protein
MVYNKQRAVPASDLAIFQDVAVQLTYMMREYSPAPRTAQPHRLALASCLMMRPSSAANAAKAPACVMALAPARNAKTAAELISRLVKNSSNIYIKTASNIKFCSARADDKGPPLRRRRQHIRSCVHHLTAQ